MISYVNVSVHHPGELKSTESKKGGVRLERERIIYEKESNESFWIIAIDDKDAKNIIFPCPKGQEKNIAVLKVMKKKIYIKTFDKEVYIKIKTFSGEEEILEIKNGIIKIIDGSSSFCQELKNKKWNTLDEQMKQQNTLKCCTIRCNQISSDDVKSSIETIGQNKVKEIMGINPNIKLVCRVYLKKTKYYNSEIFSDSELINAIKIISKNKEKTLELGLMEYGEFPFKVIRTYGGNVYKEYMSIQNYPEKQKVVVGDKGNFECINWKKI